MEMVLTIGWHFRATVSYKILLFELGLLSINTTKLGNFLFFSLFLISLLFFAFDLRSHELPFVHTSKACLHSLSLDLKVSFTELTFLRKVL